MKPRDVARRAVAMRGMGCNGPIAVFDVLGYSVFLASHDAREAASLVLRTLWAVPEIADDVSLEALDPSSSDTLRKRVREVNSGIRHLIISDTIILLTLLKVDTQGDEYALDYVRLLTWRVFLERCSAIMGGMFIAGFPLRGAINFGDYYLSTDGSILTGKAMISCYEQGKQTDWSGCILTSEASEDIIYALKRQPRWFEAVMPLIHEYPVPMRCGDSTLSWVLKWGPYNPADDSGRAVERAFSAHGKVVTDNERSKVANTATFLRVMRTKAGG
jgi:hypothetical protein